MMKQTKTGLKPFVVDFGLARLDDPTEQKLTRTGQIFGTPHYMSPEQIKGESSKMGPSCDIYSLGVIFYELLTGQTPFEGTTALVVVAQILMNETPRPSEIRCDLDPRYETICMKAMAKDVAERYGSMEDFARALDEVLATPSWAKPPFQRTGSSESTKLEWTGGSSMFDPNSSGHSPPMSLETAAPTSSPAPAETKRSHSPVPTERGGPPRDAELVAAVREERVVPPPIQERTIARAEDSPARKEPKKRFSIGHAVGIAVLATIGFCIVSWAIFIQSSEKGDGRRDTPSGRLANNDSNSTPSARPAIDPKPITKNEDKHSPEPSKETKKEATAPAPVAAGDPKTWTSPATGMQFVLLPAGTFQMGSDRNVDKDAQDDEIPRHAVRIAKPFYLGKFEVTRGQFRKFVEETGYKTEAESDGKGGVGWNASKKTWEQDPKYTWVSCGFDQTDTHPVVNVSWNDAKKFWEWLNGKKDGYTYRLPTEAEWEYACRAGSKTKYSFGDDPEDLAKYDNVFDATCKEKTMFPWPSIDALDGYVFSAPVGSFKKNEWGLHDMHGNVYEWCSDEYSADDYKAPRADDPQGPLEGASFRVGRGGAWDGIPSKCRSAKRNWSWPGYRSNDLGFRLTAVRAEPPNTWTSPTTGMQFVLIPTGEFQMGSNKGDKDTQDDEIPRHPVRITKPFFLGKFEVTRGQFRKFVEETGYKTEAESDGKGGSGWNGSKKTWEQDPKYTWKSCGFDQSDAHPVVNVSWNDANKFCEWLNGKKDGYTYRLPTEAEWEYACRAGSKTKYAFGDDPEDLAKYGNGYDATCKEKITFPWPSIAAKDGQVFTAPVGSFERNAWGLYDVHGNVWEWCSDWHSGDYYKGSPADDPQGPSAAASFRVLRGGSWSNDPSYCRLTDRYGGTPGNRDNDLGFRLAAVRAG